MIWLSQMFTWVFKKCLNLTFKENFLYQKSFKTFWFFLHWRFISFEEGSLLLSFFENFNFWTASFLYVGKFLTIRENICEYQVKRRFSFYMFFAKIYSLFTHICKTPLWGHTKISHCSIFGSVVQQVVFCQRDLLFHQLNQNSTIILPVYFVCWQHFT